MLRMIKSFREADRTFEQAGTAWQDTMISINQLAYYIQQFSRGLGVIFDPEPYQREQLYLDLLYAWVPAPIASRLAALWPADRLPEIREPVRYRKY